MTWAFVSAVNSEPVLRSCLLSSPDVSRASEVLLQRGFSSAAAAYNAAIQETKADWLVFVHQDVFLPEGWLAAAQSAIQRVMHRDPNCAVLGPWGVKRDGGLAGHIYCAGLQKVLGESFEGGQEVRTLDEVLLILRRSSGLRFDERLGGFHLYGTDLCLEASRREMKCYAISAFCVHNTNGYNFLPSDFWKTYFFLRKKWQKQLPIVTSCTKITFWCWPMVWWNLDRVANILLSRHKPGKRVPDPVGLYRRITPPAKSPA